MTTSSMTFDLDGFLATEQAAIEHSLAAAVADLEPILSPEFFPAVRHGVTVGGKRLRPILCVEAFHACGGMKSDPIYRLGTAVELIHAYSLMHDDVPCMDDAPLRRGHPTTHRLFGESVTTRAGAALIPAAGRLAWLAATELGCADSARRSIVRELMCAAGAGGMVGGQVLDLIGENQQLSADQLDELHMRKTGALLTACLHLGGLAADAEGTKLAGLIEYGTRIGLAFQIADDILDVTASPEVLGKAPSDAELGKSTYVTTHGLDGARARAATEVSRAIDALQQASIHSAPLEALAHFIVERDR